MRSCIFLHYSVREVIYKLIDVLGHFQSFCIHEIFVELNLPIFVVLVGQQEKSQKYFDLSARILIIHIREVVLVL